MTADPAGAFYLPCGEGEYAATGHTVGPWSERLQHLGPPSALLVRELERCAPRPDLALRRVTIDVLGPVPPVQVRVRATVLRPGRTVELLAAELTAGGRTMVAATGWRLAVSDEVGRAAQAEAGPAGGDRACGEGAGMPPVVAAVARDLPLDGWIPGYLNAVEWRWARGGFDLPGPAAAWGRLRVAVVEGEQPSPLQRLFAVADSANGIAGPLDLRRWMYLNTDLTVHLHRDPAGEWTGVDAATTVGPSGAGVCSAVLHDTAGPVGRAAQVLTIRPR
jgi:hypothetical protein